jgi:hypothetical protein
MALECFLRLAFGQRSLFFFLAESGPDVLAQVGLTGL